MYTWKELPKSVERESKLQECETEFIHGLAHVMTHSILRKLRNLTEEELEAILAKVRQDPTYVATLCYYQIRPSPQEE